jgi:hypothetical protein
MDESRGTGRLMETSRGRSLVIGDWSDTKVLAGPIALTLIVKIN